MADDEDKGTERVAARTAGGLYIVNASTRWKEEAFSRSWVNQCSIACLREGYADEVYGVL
jgi:hypothetical protein